MQRLRNILIVVLMLATLAFASTQGPNSAATITGTGWTSPTNAATTNAIYATQTISALSCSGILTFSGYGFAIPVGAAINGITVSIVGHASTATNLDLANSQVCGGGVQLTKTVGVGVGSVITDATVWPIADTTFTEGSGANLWGTTWAPGDINASGFGVLVTLENTNATLTRTASVDSVLITVTFTPGCTSCFMPFLTGRSETQTRSVAKEKTGDSTSRDKWEKHERGVSGRAASKLRLELDSSFCVIDLHGLESAEHVLADEPVTSDSCAFAESINVSGKYRQVFCGDAGNTEVGFYFKRLSAESVTARLTRIFHFGKWVFPKSSDAIRDERAAGSCVDDKRNRFPIHFCFNEDEPLC